MENLEEQKGKFLKARLKYNKMLSGFKDLSLKDNRVMSIKESHVKLNRLFKDLEEQLQKVRHELTYYNELFVEQHCK